MHTPQFITFTGADDYTGIDDMQALSRDYPVEFGILFSPTRQGSGRYPSLSFVERLHSTKLSLAAHVCGGHSRELITTGHIEPLQSLLTSGLFNRVQVNTADAKASPAAIRDWTQAFNLLPILQSRGEDRFPESRDVTWLFDRSGGRGTLATVWPVESDTQRLVGFGAASVPTTLPTRSGPSAAPTTAITSTWNPGYGTRTTISILASAVPSVSRSTGDARDGWPAP